MSEQVNKVDAIIKTINDLSNDEKRELTIKVRTTPEGIKAYTSFLYGVTSSASEPSEEPEEPTPCENDSSCETPSEPGNTESESENN